MVFSRVSALTIKVQPNIKAAPRTTASKISNSGSAVPWQARFIRDGWVARIMKRSLLKVFLPSKTPLIITGAIHGVTPSVEGARKMQQLLLHPV